MSATIDERLMAQAISQARLAEGRTSPNPAVGCVIVRDGEVVGRGYTNPPGGPHAEISALRDASDARGATAYVTLEPCCVHGRTPPCTDALIAAGIVRVVAGSQDPDERVNGQGFAALRAAGIEVVSGVRQSCTDELLAPFAKRVLTGLPFVTMKYAMTLDGRMATATGHSAWITGEESRHHVHGLRDRHDAILVGTGTLVADNPRLNCRLPLGRSPARILLDASLRAPLDSKAYSIEDGAGVHVMTSERAPLARREALEAQGVCVHVLPLVDGHLSMEDVLRQVASAGYNSVFIEGGAQIHGSVLDARLADQVYAYIAPSLMGGSESLGPVGGHGVLRADTATRLEVMSMETLGQDICMRAKVPLSARAFPIPYF